MIKMKRCLKIEPATVAVVLAFTIGLGLAVHEAFFLVPLVIVLIVVGEWTARKTHEYLGHFHLRSRHP